MEKRHERARRREEPAGVVRCPFCHDGIDVDAHAWVVCHRCLARHHPGCWDEATGCATCGDRRRLTATPPARRRRVSLALAGTLLVGVAIGALARGPLADLARGLTPRRERVARRAEPAAERPLPSYVRERVGFLVSEGRLDEALAYLHEQGLSYPGARREVEALREELQRLRGD